MTTVYLVRHAESEVNATQCQIGQASDVPLTNKGKEQAAKLGKYFHTKGIKFNHIFCSTYQRASNTCKIITDVIHSEMNLFSGSSCPPIIETAMLREYSAGIATGTPRSETITPEIAHKMLNLGMAFKFPGGESMFDVETRVAEWFYDSIVEPKLQGNILVVSHGQAIKSLLHYLMGFDHRFGWRIILDNTSMTMLKFKYDQWFLGGVNLTPHLEQLLEES